jgi:hypothetical protein
VADDLAPLFARIRALTAAAREGKSPRRDQVEPTLTEGYARALELDAECLRLEERIDRLTRAVAAERDVPPEQLSELLRRLNWTEQRSANLRALLEPLRELMAKAA